MEDVLRAISASPSCFGARSGGSCLPQHACAAYTVYVSNEKGNSITVIDSATLEVQADHSALANARAASC